MLKDVAESDLRAIAVALLERVRRLESDITCLKFEHSSEIDRHINHHNALFERIGEFRKSEQNLLSDIEKLRTENKRFKNGDYIEL